MNNDVCNRIHVALQRAADGSGAEGEGVFSGCRRQITGSRALCPPRTDSPRWFDDGASVVALSATEKGPGLRESGDSFFSIEGGFDAAICDFKERRHNGRSRSRIANVTLVFCRICSLQTPERDPETTRGQH